MITIFALELVLHVYSWSSKYIITRNSFFLRNPAIVADYSLQLVTSIHNILSITKI